jgi:hypothetical protein
MSDARETLRRGIGGFVPRPDGYERVLRRRDRKRRNQRITAGALAAAIVIIGALAFAGALRSAPPPPMNHDNPRTNTRPVFERTATVGGLTVTSPSDWYLVDYWGEWTLDFTTSLSNTAIPLLELTSFDPGLSTPICDAASGEPTRLPADGVAIFVTVGNDGRKVADLCGGSVEASATGAISGNLYRSVMTIGPDVTEKTRAAAEKIWRSLDWTSFYSYNREQAPAYVLDGWSEEGLGWLLEARTSERGVELYEIAPFSHYGDGAHVVPRASSPIQGETVGVVTEDAAKVEYRRAGVGTPLVGKLIDLPPSLASGFDAYVFAPQPTEGPFEVVAIGMDGEVLGSTLPPLVNTERVGTVRAFGTAWTVKFSTSADGSWASTCVEPAATDRATDSLDPCERGPGGGMLVQSSDGQNPSVFVTQFVGDDVGAIDVQGDDGTVFHAVMLPHRGSGGKVAVVALEGEGEGRFVYYLTDGRIDQGRRPEAHVQWPDLGQVIGDGSFPSPNAT